MITNAYHLLQQNGDLASRAGARFILVDEFQDVNFAQVKVLKSSPEPNAIFLRLEIRTRRFIAFAGHRALPSFCFNATFPPRS